MTTETKTVERLVVVWRDNCRWVRECVEKCRAADADLIEAMAEQRGSYDAMIEALDREQSGDV